mgnify:CR=1 FL=1
MTFPYVTDDRLFGFRSHFKYADFLDQEKTCEAQALIAATEGCVVVYGHGAALVAPEAGLTVYADMPRWEIQQRRGGTKYTISAWTTAQKSLRGITSAATSWTGLYATT